MSPKTTDIQNFFERFANYASQARGTFTIQAPPFMRDEQTGYSGLFSDDLATGITATGFTIPSQQLSTYAPFSYNGPTIDIPHTQIFTDLEVQFILAGKTPAEAAKIYQTFTRWQEYIAGYRIVKGSSAQDQTPVSLSGTSAFSSAYYGDYVANAIITVDSPNDKNIVRIEYSECYPKSIGSLQTSWDSPDTPLSLSVTFGYYYARVY